MVQIDPLKVVCNTATLEAYRQHERGVRAAAQPWLSIALVAVALQIGLFLYGLFHPGLRDLGLLSSLMVAVFGLCFCVGAMRAWLYRRSHPFDLPEAPKFRWR
jgi:hypothetical protein